MNNDGTLPPAEPGDELNLLEADGEEGETGTPEVSLYVRYHGGPAESLNITWGTMYPTPDELASLAGKLIRE